MSPTNGWSAVAVANMTDTFLVRSLNKRLVEKPTNRRGLVIEAWSQGFMVGALIIMSCITLVNMRRGVILHKLILVEVCEVEKDSHSTSILTNVQLLFGLWEGFFIFNDPPVYGWFLSVSAIFLNISWSLHNVIAWMKNKPFLSRRMSRMYIITVAAVQPYWVIEIYANFTYFNNINNLFVHTRPFEALFRYVKPHLPYPSLPSSDLLTVGWASDPWWIFTTCSLFYNIKTRYELTFSEIFRISPRFVVMLLAMVLSTCFMVIDIMAVTGVFSSTLPLGVNPYWKLSFVFKCLTDSVILDDFKTALDRLRAFKISRLGSFVVDGSTTEQSWRKGLSQNHHPWAAMEGTPSLDARVTNDNSIFSPHGLGAKVTAGPAAGTRPLISSTDRSEWDNMKETVNHYEDLTLERGNSRDRDEEENMMGIASRKDLKEPEPSWLGNNAGSNFRVRRAGGKTMSVEERDVETDSLEEVDPRDDNRIGRAK